MNETDVASYVDDNTSNVVGNNIKDVMINLHTHADTLPVVIK